MQIKGLWVTREYLESKSKIAEFVDTAKRIGFNTLFVQVRGRGDAYYTSSFVPKAEALAHDPSFDPLEYVVRMAHIYELKVHAWFNVFYLWSSKSSPKSDRHLMNNHPEWMCRDDNGVSMLDFKQNQLRKKAIEGIYLSPENPEVHAHILKVLKEVAANYNIDGIHLDYVRYPERDFGFGKTLIAEYTNKYFIDPVQLLKNPKFILSRNGEEKYKELFKGWNDLKAAMITNLISKVRIGIEEVNNDISLSSAVKADLDDAKRRYAQFWDDWVINGDVDFVVPMNYVKGIKDFDRNNKKIFQNVPGEKVIMGIAIYNSDFKNLKKKLQSVFSSRVKGFSIFSYDTLKKNNKMFELFKNFNFSESQ